MLVLNTNHVSELFYRSSAGERLRDRLLRHGGEVFTTAVTVEESLRGWLAEIRRHHDARRQIPAYTRLLQQLELFAAWLILPWDDDAADRFDTLRSLRGKVGSQDLKIASIALAHQATLLTKNRAHFEPVPGLRVENWLD